MAYSKQVIDHFENPRNAGSFNKDDLDVGVGLVGAPACGDLLKLQIKVQDGIIVDARFKTYGCGSAIEVAAWSRNGSRGKLWTKLQQLRIQKLLLNCHCHLLRYIARF